MSAQGNSLRYLYSIIVQKPVESIVPSSEQPRRKFKTIDRSLDNFHQIGSLRQETGFESTQQVLNMTENKNPNSKMDSAKV